MTSQASVLWSDEDLSVNLPPSRHAAFHVWQEDFPALKGGGDSLFSATQVEPSLEKEKLAAVQKKVKIKRSLKKWVMEKPWNLTRQISSIKKLLGILVFEEKPSSARRTLPI